MRVLWWPFLIAAVLLCPQLPAEHIVLVPKVKRGKSGGVEMQYEVDRNEDPFDKKRESTGREIRRETISGWIREGPDEFGHYLVAVRRGADGYLELAESCRMIRDQAIGKQDLKEGDRLVVAGAPRGYVPGPVEGDVRPRIYGALFILRMDSGEGDATPPPKTEKKPSANAPLTGEVLSLTPLVVKDRSGALYEIRPAASCRIVVTGDATAEDVKPGSQVRLVGSREKVVLRPKGRTLFRLVLKCESLRLLAPEISETEYRPILDSLTAK